MVTQRESFTIENGNLDVQWALITLSCRLISNNVSIVSNFYPTRGFPLGKSMKSVYFHHAGRIAEDLVLFCFWFEFSWWKSDRGGKVSNGKFCLDGGGRGEGICIASFPSFSRFELKLSIMRWCSRTRRVSRNWSGVWWGNWEIVDR
jgi:hypothetical protein